MSLQKISLIKTFIHLLTTYGSSVNIFYQNMHPSFDQTYLFSKYLLSKYSSIFGLCTVSMSAALMKLYLLLCTDPQPMPRRVPAVHAVGAERARRAALRARVLRHAGAPRAHGARDEVHRQHARQRG